MKEIVDKELVDKIMNYINYYHKQVNYGLSSVDDVEKYRKAMVENIVRLCLDKIL